MTKTSKLRKRIADLEAENARLARGGETLGRVIEQQCKTILDVTGLHDWIDEDGDGDWGAIWENALELRPERDKLAAENQRLREQLAQARAATLREAADKWDAQTWIDDGHWVVSTKYVGDWLRENARQIEAGE